MIPVYMYPPFHGKNVRSTEFNRRLENLHHPVPPLEKKSRVSGLDSVSRGFHSGDANLTRVQCAFCKMRLLVP